jgi:hypothetical protein
VGKRITHGKSSRLISKFNVAQDGLNGRKRRYYRRVDYIGIICRKRDLSGSEWLTAPYGPVYINILVVTLSFYGGVNNTQYGCLHVNRPSRTQTGVISY